MNKITIICIFVLMFFSISSCTVQKRHYMQGYHVDWKTKHHPIKKSDNKKTNEFIRDEKAVTFVETTINNEIIKTNPEQNKNSTEKIITDNITKKEDNTIASVDNNIFLPQKQKINFKYKINNIVENNDFEGLALPVKNLQTFYDDDPYTYTPLRERTPWEGIFGFSSGLVGFIIAMLFNMLVGLVFLTVGIVFSSIGLKRPRKGFAIAGLVISAIGTALTVIMLMVLMIATVLL